MKQKVIVIISCPQECGDYTIDFISTFDGQIIKTITIGNATDGSVNNEIFERDNSKGIVRYYPERDYLAKSMWKDYHIKLPTTIKERYAILPKDLAQMIANKMDWQILGCYNY